MSKNIEELKQRYWQGETSLEEERIIKQWYETQNSSDDSIGAYFSYFKDKKGVVMTRDLKKPTTMTFSMRRVMMMAASMALVAAVYFGMPDASSNKKNVEITDPQLALELTREALSVIGNKMDKSETIVKEGIARLDKTYINRIL